MKGKEIERMQGKFKRKRGEYEYCQESESQSSGMLNHHGGNKKRFKLNP